jgi:guanylate kinase
MHGLLYVISGPSGVGKSTLIKNALKSLNGFDFSVSYTTRPKRDGETEGIDYFFVDEKTFFEMRDKNEFLEWAKVHGNYYATSKSFVEKKLKECRGLVLDVDVQGALNIQKKYEEAIYIFILPPSIKDLEKRLKNRGTETAEIMQIRLNNAKWEMSKIDNFDYIVVNHEVSESSQQLTSILVAEQLKRERYNELTSQFFFFKKQETEGVKANGFRN